MSALKTTGSRIKLQTIIFMILTALSLVSAFIAATGTTGHTVQLVCAIVIIPCNTVCIGLIIHSLLNWPRRNMAVLIALSWLYLVVIMLIATFTR